MKKSKRFKYYQPNALDLKDMYGDCTIRAMSKVLNCTWLEAFDRLIPFCRKYQASNVFNTPLEIRKEILKAFGLEYHGVSNKSGTKRPTVDEFAKDHPTGTFLLHVAHHEVACVDGIYYDTWDSGHCSMYGYYQKV